MNGSATYSAIIAEDEPLLRAEIREALHALWPELVIRAEVGDGIRAIQAIDHYAPNVVFLDIQMPGMSGLDVARHASGKTHVVLISAYNQYAMTAFEQGVLDYLQKPITLQRMDLTVTRLKERLREPPAHLNGLADLLKSIATSGPEYLKWLTMPKGAELQVVAVSDVHYLRADNKYTNVATRNATFLLNSSLKDLLQKLDPAMFWQINRGIAVNVGAIDKIYRSFRGALEIKVKERDELLPVSAAHAHLFKHV